MRVIHIPAKPAGGYGRLYNWWCTQPQKGAIKHGYLYNGYVALDSRNISAANARVFTNADFATLETSLGGSSIAGGKLKETGLTYWLTPNTGATNELDFNARGISVRDEAGAFGTALLSCYLWTNTSFDADNSYLLAITSGSADTVSGITDKKKRGQPVRFIKDTTDYTPGETLTDIDGYTYRVVKIGDQVWLADNWACTKLNDGTPIANVTGTAAWAALTTLAYCDYDNDPTNSVYNEDGISDIGYYRIKKQVSGNETVLLGTLSKEIVSIEQCPGGVILKYLDKNGQYRFFPFNKYYKSYDTPEQGIAILRKLKLIAFYR